jgi:demethylmenaquinone methyltransferase / 2-methoxy-6-polyprenyl-1,4-benzoquinol methylase
MFIVLAKLNKKDVVEVYTQTAPIYDVWGSLTETKARKRSLSLAQIKDGESILEVATGTGLTFQEILRANPHGKNIGVDLTPAMLEKAKSRIEKLGIDNYQLAVGDAYHLHFPDRQFDLLMNNYMFDLLPENDFVTVLEEFKRVLKPKGRIVLVNMTKGKHFHQRFWESVYRLNPRWLGGCRGVLLSRSMQTAGFMDVTRETTSEMGFPSEIISAKVE